MDKETHIRHCFTWNDHGEFDGCKYGLDEDCPAKPTAKTVTQDYRIAVTINGTVHEVHDITKVKWGNNTRDIAASTLREISERLVRENVASFGIEFGLLND